MSKIFKNTLKIFTSDITGEKREYKVNNAVWLYMDSLFDMNQSKFDEELDKNNTTATGMFVTSVMKANELEVTLEEVLENTAPVDLLEFYNGFFDIAFRVKDSQKEIKEKTVR